MAETNTTETKGVFYNLFKLGKLPDFNTNIVLDSRSLFTASAAVFLAGFFIIITWYAIRKLN